MKVQEKFDFVLLYNLTINNSILKQMKFIYLSLYINVSSEETISYKVIMGNQIVL